MDVAGRLELVVQALVGGKTEEAQATLQAIDQQAEVFRRREAYKAIWGPDGLAKRARPHQPVPRRGDVPARVKREVFARDRYTCRYAHCQRRTVALPVLRHLSRIFPDVIPGDQRWNPLDRHVLYWSYSTSLEHHVAFAHGGANDTANLLTSCYECNDLKNRLHADDLGWSVGPPSTSEWRGLTEYEPGLRLVADSVRVGFHLASSPPMRYDATMIVWVNTADGWVAHGRPRSPVTAARVAKRLLCMDGWDTEFGAVPPPARPASPNAPSPEIAAHSPAPLATWPRRLSSRQPRPAAVSLPFAPADQLHPSSSAARETTAPNAIPVLAPRPPIRDQPFEAALREYYESQHLSAERFACRHAADCSAVCKRFVGACEAFIGSRYGRGAVPRLLFVSADPARDLSNGRPADRAMPVVRAREEAQARPITGGKAFPKQGHWYKTFHFAHGLLGAITSAAGGDLIAFAEVSRFLAHTNSAKCKDLEKRTSQGHARLFKNCRNYVPGEIAALRPHLLITQGRAARESLQSSARILTTHRFDRSKQYHCDVIGLHGVEMLWIAMNHPNARDGSYQAEIRDAWGWYCEQAVEYVRRVGAPPFDRVPSQPRTLQSDD